MALKRDYLEGTKYSYARISFVHFHKDEVINISVQITERDYSDLEYCVEKNSLTFKYTQSKPWFLDYFALSVLNAVDKNIIQQAYLSLKDKEDLFRDYVDC